MTRYAVNIVDMFNPSRAYMMGILLGPVIQGRQVVETDKKRFDEMAVVLECDEVRAKAIVDVIRLKFRRHELRCYECVKKTAWRRV